MTQHMNKRAHGQLIFGRLSINSSRTKLLSLNLSRTILRRRSGFDFLNAVFHNRSRAVETKTIRRPMNEAWSPGSCTANKDFVMREQKRQGRSKSNDRGSKKTE